MKVPLLKIHPEFKKLIPPLIPVEYENLKKSLLMLGCQDNLKVWNGYIVDGHNRYEVCTRNNIPFKTEELDFPDESYAIEMIYINQIGRRNINEYCRAEAVVGLKKIWSKQGHRTDLLRKNKELPQNSAEVANKGKHYKQTTPYKLAEKAAVSHDTIHRVSKIVDFASEKEKEDLRKGKLSINKVYVDQKKRNLRPPEFPKEKYSIIYSNFFEETQQGWVPKKFITQICDLPVNGLLEQKAVAFLVATPRYLKETLTVMKAWGLKYVGLMVMDGWKSFDSEHVKDEHHLVLMGTKGEYLPESLPSFLYKDKDLHTLIDEMYPKGKRLDIFWEKKKEGWDTY